MRQQLNDMAVARLKSTATGQFTVWDAALPSFGVRVGLTAKTFVLKQQNRWYTLGRYPIVTLKQARDEAKRRLALKYFPQQSINSVEAIALYLAAQDLKASSHAQYERILTSYVPKKQLAALTFHDLKAALGSLTPSHANLAHSVFKAFLNWCVANQLLDKNPLLGLKKHKTKTRDRLLSDAEVVAIWHESCHHNAYGNLLRLSLLSGQRMGQWKRPEIIQLRDNVLVFPHTSMKGNIEHHLPATPLILQHFYELRPVPSPSSAMEKLRAALPQIPHFTLHDARRYLSSSMAKLQVRQEVTERILAHKTGGAISPIAAVYNRHTYESEMRKALELYEAHLLRLLKPE